MKTKEYKIKKAILAPEHLKAQRFDELRKLVLELDALRKDKKRNSQEYSEKIEAVYQKVKGIVSQDANQFQMNLNGKEDEEGGEEHGAEAID